ncbi:MAG: extracellular solute-binding protein family 1 [Paenibacillus sp.]|jgi:multiple sugar transport system substrate-binding protein|nr:extracellular solute-binding protein family 1 [Paenibacillus sp.]
MAKHIYRPVCGFIIGCSALLSACGGDSGGEAAPAKEDKAPKSPITMVIHGAGVTMEELESRYRDHLVKKFPHITFTFLRNDKGNMMEDLVAQGTIPDIVRPDTNNVYSSYLDLGLGEDLTPYVKKYRYDLSRFNKVFVDEIVDAARTGELYGLPQPPFFPHALYYNKDLFDQFGVPYPKDGMTWDEVYEIAKRMTRTNNNKLYRGFSFNPVSGLRDNPYHLPILDLAADRLANTEQWASLFQNFLRFYQIPDNTIAASTSAENGMFAKGSVALMANQHNVYLNISPEVDWDIVTYPTYAEGQKLMPQRGPAYWSITKQSKHKDEAFQVIMEMLSDEVQLEDSRRGIPSTLVNPQIQQVLGQGSPVFSTKNMAALYQYPPAPYTPKRKAELPNVPQNIQQNLLGAAFMEAAKGAKDVNTALRELNEMLRLEVNKVKNQ